MFDSKQTLTKQLANAADLMIDFATLGEYGLEEPVGRTRQGCAEPTSPHLAGPTRASARSAQCNLLEESGLFRGPRRNAVRKRGVRDASLTSRANGVA